MREEYKYILISKDDCQLEPYQQLFDTYNDALEYATNIFYYQNFDILQVKIIQLFKYRRDE